MKTNPFCKICAKKKSDIFVTICQTLFFVYI